MTKLCANNASDRRLFQEEVRNRVKEAWKDNRTLTEKWLAIRSALTGAAESILGTEHRRYPDWFAENAGKLEPLFQNRNHLYSKRLSTGKESDWQCFAKARSEARRAITEVKNEWFQDKAKEANHGRFGGKKVWQCIRDIQCG